MSPIFLDTVGLIALWDVSDQWHDAASQAFNRISSQRQKVVTTPYVMLECGNSVARRRFRKEVCLFREHLEQRGELIVPTNEDWITAWGDYEAQTVGDAGIVDHVSFVVMRRLGLTTAFTNDTHFQAAGFITLF